MANLTGVRKSAQYTPVIFFLFVLPLILSTGPCSALEWEINVVDTVGDVGRYCSLALDGNGYPHISYINQISHALKYAHWTGTNWQIEEVSCPAANSGRTSIALDGSGYPHVGFSHVEDESTTIVYAHRTTSGWEWYPLWSGLSYYDDLAYTSLEIDNAGYCHVLCSEPYMGNLVYIWESSTGWHVDYDGMGGKACLAIDSTNCPHCSSTDGVCSRSFIRYSYKESQTGEWIRETVEDGARGQTSLDLDQSGFPHMSYDRNHYLNYAYRDSFEWHVEVLDGSETDYFLNPSLELDCQDYPHIAYVKETDDPPQRPKLHYCGHDFIGWQDTDRLHRSFSKNEGELLCAYKDSGGWHVEAVDYSLSGFEETSIAVDDYGNVHIAYYDADGCALKYARMVGVPVMDDLVWPPGIELVEIWPNPSSGILFSRIVDPSALTGTRFYLVDIAGRNVAELYTSIPGDRNNTSITFRIPDAVSNGIYLLRAVNPETSRMIPVTIIK